MVPRTHHLVADHLVPLITGHDPCSDLASNVPSGLMDQKIVISPEEVEEERRPEEGGGREDRVQSGERLGSARHLIFHTNWASWQLGLTFLWLVC